MTFERLAGILSTLLFLTVQPAKTQTTWNAVPDFTTAANPNGVWSYGWEGSLGGSFNIYVVPDAIPVLGIDAWLERGTYPFDPPYVARNVTAKPSCHEAFCVPVRYLQFHPGSDGAYSVVRWTAPVGGLSTLEGAFVGLDYGGPTTTDVHVLVNSTGSLYQGEIASFNQPLPFQGTVALNAGDTLDFAVGFGVNGNYYSDSTGIRVSIKLR